MPKILSETRPLISRQSKVMRWLWVHCWPTRPTSSTNETCECLFEILFSFLQMNFCCFCNDYQLIVHRSSYYPLWSWYWSLVLSPEPAPGRVELSLLCWLQQGPRRFFVFRLCVCVCVWVIVIIVPDTGVLRPAPRLRQDLGRRSEKAGSNQEVGTVYEAGGKQGGRQQQGEE